MAFPRLKTFCCGCSLRSGTLVTAWLQIICAIVNTALMETIELSNAIDIILNLLQLALGVVLVYGTKRRLSAYINAYVISGVIATCVATTLVVPSVVDLLLYDLTVGGVAFAILAVMFLSYWYALTVISSFRKEILDDTKEE